jgi:TPR repeat protein
VPQDYTEAILWYRKAAYQGNAEAEHDLGYMYYYGQDLPQDYTEARRWYRKAADHGYPEARRALRSIERKSSIATRIRYVVLFIAFLGGLVLSFGFLWPGRSFRNSRHATLLGVIALSYAGLSLYGIAHDDMRYSVCRNTFYLAERLLIGMAIIMGITVILAKQRQAESQEPSRQV